MGKSITMFDLFIRKNTNYLRTNTNDATFSINVPISKKFQKKKKTWPPLSSNLGSVPGYCDVGCFLPLDFVVAVCPSG